MSYEILEARIAALEKNNQAILSLLVALGEQQSTQLLKIAEGLIASDDKNESAFRLLAQYIPDEEKRDKFITLLNHALVNRDGIAAHLEQANLNREKRQSPEGGGAS